MTIETLKARFKRLREAKGLTKYRLAKLAGISQTYIYRIEQGEIKNPRRDTLQALAQGLNITLAYLLGETAPSDAWQLVEQSLKAFVPVYAEIHEGVGMSPVDYVASTQSKIPPDSLRAYRIVGLSFAPDIQSGDTIFVDTSRTPKVGNLVVVIHEEQPAIRVYSGSEVVNIHGVITECNHKLV